MIVETITYSVAWAQFLLYWTELGLNDSRKYEWIFWENLVHTSVSLVRKTILFHCAAAGN